MDPINLYSSISAADKVASYSNISNVNQLNKDGEGSAARQYKPGNSQNLKGEIIDLKNNEITIRLDDGNKITAKIYDTSNLNIGQRVRFNVSDTPSGPVIDKIDAPAATADTIVFKALEATGLPANERNIEVVMELLHHNMALDKQSILTIQKQSLINRSVSISSLVLMSKNNIPFTSENAEQFEQYCHYEHRIVKEADSIANLIPNLIDSLATDTEKNAADLVNFNKELCSIINDNRYSNYVDEPIVASAYQYPEAANELGSILEKFDVSPELLKDIASGTASLRDVANAIKSSMEKADELDDYRVSNLNSQKQSHESLVLVKDSFANPAVTTVLDRFAAIQRDNCELSSYMNDYNRAQLISKLRDIPNSDALIARLWKGDISSNEMLSRISDLLSSSDGQASTRLLVSEQYKSIITQALLNNWTISPNELKKNTAIVEDTYKNMYSQIDRLERFVADNSTNNETLSKNFSGTKNNIDFMNTLNEMLTYVQLPLKLRNQNVHSDLYVLTNKKKLGKSATDINILLHLDMEYTGSMDISLNMSGNNIRAKFGMTDKDSKELFATNMEQLEMALLEKGFLLHSEVELQDKTVDLIDDFLNNESVSTSLKRYTFDVRT